MALIGRSTAVSVSLLFVAAFLCAWGFGLTHYGAGSLIVPAIILSGLAWLAAAIMPLWFLYPNVAAALFNGLAAALAIYAGLCASPPLAI